MGAARETSHSSKTKFARYRGVPSLVGSGITLGGTTCARLPGLDRRTGGFWALIPRDKRAGQSAGIAFRQESSGNGPPLVALASAGRGIARTRIQALRGRSAGRG